MVRQIVWTERAQKERIEILTFWNNHNKSTSYSKKLNKLIRESLKLISRYPLIGKPTNKENVKVKILKNYLLIYELTSDEIIVLSVWDCRQKPIKL
ncbi:MAG: type II toxin-antitoxin system RelE/ParE family toxin [Bacteroidota bacterium]|nr:type II toxin-antitoxin system RelE/ParE family toxin [Bacteroidota bacterium]